MFPANVPGRTPLAYAVMGALATLLGSDTSAVQLRRAGLVLLDSLGRTAATLTATCGEYDPEPAHGRVSWK